MKKYIYSCLLFFTLNGFFAFNAIAQANEVTVGGDVTKPFKIDAASFAAMNQVKVKVKANNGMEHTYTGVLLYDLINQADAIPNKQLKGKALTKYVLVTAADGYQIVIALPEFDPAFNDKQIILANKEDDEALAANFGPYRLIVPGDKRPARSAMRVVSIDVLTAKKP